MRTGVCTLLLLLSTAGVPAAADWLQWRGPLGTGEAPGTDPPVTFRAGDAAWKTAIPGKGLSTPIVVGRRIFVTTAVAHGEELPADAAQHHDEGAHNNVTARRRHRFVVLALDRATGKPLWRRVLRDERPHEATHSTGSWASASPVSDGERLYVSFGSRGIFALDLDGNPLWERDLGDMRTRHEHGEGSSPALHGGTLVVNWDHQGESFLVALDAASGETRWRVARDEITSWSSPLIVEHRGEAQVIVAATKFVRAYDLADGRELWRCAGLSRNVVATPLARDGIVYVGHSYDWQALLAIDLAKAKGDITDGPAVLWKKNRHTPYVPSPVLAGSDLCYLRHLSGVLTCVDAKSGGQRAGPLRLGAARNVFASPVSAAGRLYVASRDGVVAVVDAGKGYRLTAQNRLDDSFSASPVVVGNTIYLRGDEWLWAFERPVSPPPAAKRRSAR